MWANDLDAEELETANMSPLPRHTRYRAYRLKDETRWKCDRFWLDVTP